MAKQASGVQLPEVPVIRQRQVGFMDDTVDMQIAIDELAQLAGMSRAELGRMVVYVGLTDIASRFGQLLVAGEKRYELMPVNGKANG